MKTAGHATKGISLGRTWLFGCYPSRLASLIIRHIYFSQDGTHTVNTIFSEITFPKSNFGWMCFKLRYGMRCSACVLFKNESICCDVKDTVDDVISSIRMYTCIPESGRYGGGITKEMDMGLENTIFASDIPAAVSYDERAKQIWRTLSAISVKDKVEKKVGHNYLSWAWAWGVLMDNFPDSHFTFERTDSGNEVFEMGDRSCEVRCNLTVGGITRTMWLPVMDHRNAAIKNPDARALNDTKMRCLVKAMALFGLGHYIYAGEDLPDASKTPPKAEEVTADTSIDDQTALLKLITDATTVDELKTAYAKASKYAKNRSDTPMLAAFTTAKDMMKAKLA